MLVGTEDAKVSAIPETAACGADLFYSFKRRDIAAATTYLWMRQDARRSQLYSGSDNTSAPFDERGSQALKMADGADPCPVFSPGDHLPGEGGEKLSAGDLGIRRCLLRCFTKLATAAHSTSESESP